MRFSIFKSKQLLRKNVFISRFSILKPKKLLRKCLYKEVFNLQISLFFNQPIIYKARTRERNSAQKIRIGWERLQKYRFLKEYRVETWIFLRS